MFICLECGKKFATAKAAERAVDQGCPSCGGVDIDEAPLARIDRGADGTALQQIGDIDPERAAELLGY